MARLDSLAIFSPCRRWRYLLSRDVAPLTGTGIAAFVGLNPSTADERQDDPTIRRCMNFAASWGYARMVMLNLYAWRATDPKDLQKAAAVEDIIGIGNNAAIRETADAARLVVCAWGAHPLTRHRGRDVLDILRSVGANPHCLDATADGSPRHPLYVRADTEPRPYPGNHPPSGD